MAHAASTALPPRSNVLHLAAALNRIDGERLATAGAAWAPRLSDLPRPVTALFVGGNSATYRLEHAGEAISALGERRAVGKLVVML